MFVLKRIDHTCFQPTNGTANRTANEGQTQVPILYTTLKKTSKSGSGLCASARLQIYGCYVNSLSPYEKNVFRFAAVSQFPNAAEQLSLAML